MINNKRGFTLIELLIVLGISAIIISVVSMFFINNSNSYNRVDNDTELQYQAQFVSNFVSDEMLKATNIVKVIDINNNNITQSTGSNLVKKIAIANNDSGALFELKNGNEIFYINKSNGYANVEVGKYIKEIIIRSEPISERYSDAKCINLTFIFEKDNQKLQMEQTIFFRNSN